MTDDVWHYEIQPNNTDPVFGKHVVAVYKNHRFVILNFAFTKRGAHRWAKRTIRKYSIPDGLKERFDYVD